MTRRRALVITLLVGAAALVPTARAAAQTFESADLSLVTDTGSKGQINGGPSYNERVLTVRNAGPTDAAGPITVRSNLYPSETYAAGPPSGWRCAPSGNQQVVCTFAPGLRADDQTTFSFFTTGAVPPEFCTWRDAMVSSPTFDPNLANNAGNSEADNSSSSGGRVCGSSSSEAPPSTTYQAPTKGPPTTSTTRPTTVVRAPSSTVESGTHPATETHQTTPATVLGATFDRPVVQATPTTPVVANTGIDVFDQLAIAELVFVAGVGLLLLSRARMRFAVARFRRY